MAKNYIYLPPDSINKLHMIETNASNIIMDGLSQSFDLAGIGEYGINGGFFDIKPAPSQNTKYLAINNGNGIYGNNADGYTGYRSTMGSAAICCSSSGVLKWYSAGVDNVTKIDSGYRFWAQGGPSLRLGQSSGWQSALKDEMAETYNTPAQRSAIVARISTKKVFLVVTEETVNTETFRSRIMSAFGIPSTSTASTEWVGIVLDGGASTTLRCAEKYVPSGRKLSQVILLRDKT